MVFTETELKDWRVEDLRKFLTEFTANLENLETGNSQGISKNGLFYRKIRELSGNFGALSGNSESDQGIF